MAPYVQFLRGEATDELMRHPNAFTLLALIAQRARREVPAINPFGLRIGEALVGDPASVGLSRQEYRTAISNLQKWGLVTTRSTNKGTIAMLSASVIYNINCDTTNQQSTSDQPAINQQSTTNKNEKKERIEEGNGIGGVALQLALDVANAATLEKEQEILRLNAEIEKLKSPAPKKGKSDLVAASRPDNFNLPAWADELFIAAYFDEWLPYRQSKRERLKPPSIQKQLDALGQYDSNFCQLLINKAISNGYTGLTYDDTPAKYEVYKSNQRKPFDPLHANNSSARPQPAGLIPANQVAKAFAASRALGLD